MSGRGTAPREKCAPSHGLHRSYRNPVFQELLYASLLNDGGCFGVADQSNVATGPAGLRLYRNLYSNQVISPTARLKIGPAVAMATTCLDVAVAASGFTHI
jgi:hypothetical protein